MEESDSFCTVLQVCSPSSSSRFSSLSLNFKLADFFRLVSLSKVIGSIIQDESVFTLLIATYEIPGVLSLLPMSIHVFDRVSPWLLCIVIAQASFKGSCCLSWTPPNVSEITVIGHMGTQCDNSLLIDGPVY